MHPGPSPNPSSGPSPGWIPTVSRWVVEAGVSVQIRVQVRVPSLATSPNLSEFWSESCPTRSPKQMFGEGQMLSA